MTSLISAGAYVNDVNQVRHGVCQYHLTHGVMV